MHILGRTEKPKSLIWVKTSNEIVFPAYLDMANGICILY